MSLPIVFPVIIVVLWSISVRPYTAPSGKGKASMHAVCESGMWRKRKRIINKIKSNPIKYFILLVENKWLKSTSELLDCI